MSKTAYSEITKNKNTISLNSSWKTAFFTTVEQQARKLRLKLFSDHTVVGNPLSWLWHAEESNAEMSKHFYIAFWDNQVHWLDPEMDVLIPENACLLLYNDKKSSF